MSVQKRRCVTCIHFEDARMSGNGWCTHPKRQVSSDVRILVRKGELACRNSWGGDIWASAETGSPSTEPDPAVRDSVFIANEHTEDQVTSVRASGTESGARDGFASPSASFRGIDREDIVVGHASVLPEDTQKSKEPTPLRYLADDDGLNVPAQEDQQERARIIARGSRDAILRARERHTQRRKGTDRLQLPLQQENDVTHSNAQRSEPSDDQVSFSSPTEPDSIAGERDTIAPNISRFGRRARSTDDASETLTRGRSVWDEFARTCDDPTPPVPADDVHHDPHNMVSRRADRDRFDTVPEIKPDIDLPRIRQFLQVGDGTPTGGESAGTEDADPAPLNSYDLVLRRAQAIKSATRAERQGSTVPRTAIVLSAQPRPAEKREFGNKRAGRANHLPPIEWDVEPESADVSSTHARLPDLDLEQVVTGRDEHHEPEPDAENAGLYSSRETRDAWRDVEYPELDDDDDTYIRHSPKADQSRSWWRSLNFGRLRRRPDHVDANADDWQYESADTIIPHDAEASFDNFDEDRTFVDEGYDTAAAQERTINRLSSSGHEHHPSPRESRPPVWEPLDEIEETAISPEGVQPSSRDRSFVANDARTVGQQAPRQVAAEPVSFALNDEQGMKAFRSALFGDEPSSQRDVATPIRHSRERERELVATQRQPVAARTVREPRRSEYHPLDERPREPIIAKEPLNESWDEPIGNAEFDIRDLIARQDDLLDMTIALAPDLPRMCQTCRDFRPAESGERGWCTNDWAFSHRQMVNADSLPCQSSIGCWWLPNDGSWLPEVDPAERRVPTPRTDRLVARSRPTYDHAEQEHQALYVREI